ncbi:hypothetical protein LC612_42465 [Nostoc sp. CHAB 5834]|nr:hypothetical protein [Nostoc sp. CHAB 5834]
MKNAILLIIFVVFVIANANAQNVNVDKLIENGKLRWEDFSGPVDPASKYWATTYWLVKYKYKVLSFRRDTVNIDLQTSVFLRGNSWVLPDKKTDELLEHEQGHFNMGILCTLKFKKEVASTVLLKSNYNEKIDLIFKSILMDINQMSLRYDEETNHMLNKSEQKKWNKKINNMLVDF